MTHATPGPEPQKRSKKRLADVLIVHLMAGQSIEDAATAAGISRSTAGRWLARDEGFKARYRLAREAAVAGAVGRLHESAGKAISTLLTIMGDEGAQSAVRLQAAQAILSWSTRFTELLDIEARISAIEAKANGGSSTPIWTPPTRSGS